jgi:hypothetical protein
MNAAANTMQERLMAGAAGLRIRCPSYQTNVLREVIETTKRPPLVSDEAGDDRQSQRSWSSRFSVLP